MMRGKGPQPMYDRAEIARVARNATGSQADAVAAHFGISRAYGSQLVTLARQAGHHIPYMLKKRAVVTAEDWEELARVANGASGSMSVAVAERFGVTRKHAATLIGRARDRGLSIRYVSSPRRRPVVPHSASRVGTVVSCSCGVSFQVEYGAIELARHTLKVHGRYPTAVERTPHTRQEAA